MSASGEFSPKTLELLGQGLEISPERWAALRVAYLRGCAGAGAPTNNPGIGQNPPVPPEEEGG